MERKPSIKAGLLAGCLLFALVLASLSLSPAAFAGEWRVIPIRLDFDKGTRSSVISVANDGTKPLTVSVEADQWLQDAKGKDSYAISSDLIFFPKVLTIGPKEERVIRVGIKTPAIKEEKTYRLFISENPGARKPEETGVAIAIRFGVPIFAKPVQETVQGKINNLTLEQGHLRFSVTNFGNVHFRVSTITASGLDAAGNEVFKQQLNGWYVLAGASREYDIEIPQQACRQLHDITLEAKSDRAEFSQKIDFDQASCPPR